MEISYSEQELDPERWEKLIDKLYRIKYKDEGYQYIPARDDGDCGIEGYTETGIVYQCYFPEGEYSPKDLYVKLRDKMTKDLGKIEKNIDKLKELGIVNIKEWHFVTPKYEDRNILKHANSKEKELLNKKREGIIPIIDENFKIYIKTLDDFTSEIAVLIRTSNEYKFILPSITKIDFSSCDSEKKENISRKIKVLRNNLDDEKTKKLVNTYVEFYLKGIQVLNEIRLHSPELYEEIINIENAYRINMEIKCDSNIDNNMNQGLFREILEDFEKKLTEQLGNVLSYKDIGELKQEIIGKWLADCPLDFVN